MLLPAAAADSMLPKHLLDIADIEPHYTPVAVVSLHFAPQCPPAAAKSSETCYSDFHRLPALFGASSAGQRTFTVGPEGAPGGGAGGGASPGGAGSVGRGGSAPAAGAWLTGADADSTPPGLYCGYPEYKACAL